MYIVVGMYHCALRLMLITKSKFSQGQNFDLYCDHNDQIVFFYWLQGYKCATRRQVEENEKRWEESFLTGS